MAVCRRKRTARRSCAAGRSLSFLLCHKQQRRLIDSFMGTCRPETEEAPSCARLGRRRCRANQRSADDGARRGRGVGKHRSLLPSLYVVAPCWQDLQNPTKVQEKLRPRKAHVARPILSPTLGPPYVRGGERRHRPRRETRNAAPSRQRAQPTHRHTHPDTTGWVARACLVSASGTAARATTLASLFFVVTCFSPFPSTERLGWISQRPWPPWPPQARRRANC